MKTKTYSKKAWQLKISEEKRQLSNLIRLKAPKFIITEREERIREMENGEHIYSNVFNDTKTLIKCDKGDIKTTFKENDMVVSDLDGKVYAIVKIWGEILTCEDNDGLIEELNDFEVKHLKMS